jgi:hypothetical protein
LTTGCDWAAPGFEVLEGPGATVLTRPEAAGWVRTCLARGQGLHASARMDRRASSLPGRYPVFVIPSAATSSPDGVASGHWAVRHYARGGRVFAGLLGDRYLRWGRSRPHHEIRASRAIREAGIPSPRVIAAAVYPRGLFYRADLVTEFVPNTTNLGENLFDDRRKGPGGAADRLDAIRAAGGMIMALARNWFQPCTNTSIPARTA